METNSKKVLEALPDFNDFLKLIDEIKALSIKKMTLEKDLKEQESEVFNKVMNSEQFFNNGKPVAVSYYENAYKYNGVSGELIPYRELLINVSAELDAKKAQFDVYKQMQDMYKTLVYAEKTFA